MKIVTKVVSGISDMPYKGESGAFDPDGVPILWTCQNSSVSSPKNCFEYSRDGVQKGTLMEGNSIDATDTESIVIKVFANFGLDIEAYSGSDLTGTPAKLRIIASRVTLTLGGSPGNITIACGTPQTKSVTISNGEFTV